MMTTASEAGDWKALCLVLEEKLHDLISVLKIPCCCVDHFIRDWKALSSVPEEKLHDLIAIFSIPCFPDI